MQNNAIVGWINLLIPPLNVIQEKCWTHFYQKVATKTRPWMMYTTQPDFRERRNTCTFVFVFDKRPSVLVWKKFMYEKENNISTLTWAFFDDFHTISSRWNVRNWSRIQDLSVVYVERMVWISKKCC